MSEPRICVCVVTRNQRDYIETCLRSILTQQVNADVQVLVGDDASTDGTSAIVEALAAEFWGRLKHIRHQRNVGALANMRALMAAADGDYIARVDGDDYWLAGKLARQLEYLRTNPGCSAVYANALTIDQGGSVIGVFNDLGDAHLDLPGLLRRGNVLNNSSVLFRAAGTTAWSDGGKVDYQIHLWHARHGWLGHIGEPLSAYRVCTQGSLVLSTNEHVRELYWQAIQSVPRELVGDDDYARGIADFMRRVCFRAVRTHDWRLARRWAATVYAASPFGRLHTTALVLANVGRMVGKLLGARISRLLGGDAPDILYRH